MKASYAPSSGDEGFVEGHVTVMKFRGRLGTTEGSGKVTRGCEGRELCRPKLPEPSPERTSIPSHLWRNPRLPQSPPFAVSDSLSYRGPHTAARRTISENSSLRLGLQASRSLSICAPSTNINGKWNAIKVERCQSRARSLDQTSHEETGMSQTSQMRTKCNTATVSLGSSKHLSTSCVRLVSYRLRQNITWLGVTPIYRATDN